MAGSILPVRSRFGDTTFTKIFVGGLAWKTQSSGLQRHFEQFGEILEAVVIIDKKTGRSKGYGFVTFRDPDAARRACLDPNPTIDGRRSNCNLASLGCSHHPPLAAHSGGIYIGGFQAPQPSRGMSSYLQSSPFGHQQRFLYYPYGYATYGAEHHEHGPPVAYGGYHYPPIYARHVQVNSSTYPFIQPNHSFASGYGYDPQQGIGVPGQNLHHFGPQDVNTMNTSQPCEDVYSTSRSPSALTVSASPQSTVPAHGQQHKQGATGLHENDA